MTRTKWMRLGVRDAGDILRWAGEQNTRQLDEFRHRVIHGREFVSFRMVPRYAIQIGTGEIVVVAHVQPGRMQRMLAGCRAACRRALRLASGTLAVLKPRTAVPAPHTAELYDFAAPRRVSPSRG